VPKRLKKIGEKKNHGTLKTASHSDSATSCGARGCYRTKWEKKKEQRDWRRMRPGVSVTNNGHATVSKKRSLGKGI